ncbi:hypothetical protein L1D54_07160 [Vibrio brasiliensis]|jgi:hypothetical protein|nr:hypothetical protein [Vibrio brasiliensis]MCG9750254.1 hypothetical protein [Vibrio brasiliensis]
MNERDLFAELSSALFEAKAHSETMSIKTPPVTDTAKLDVSLNDPGEIADEGTQTSVMGTSRQ